MDEIIAALVATLTATHPTYFVDVPDDRAFPYYLLWGPGGAPGDDRPLSSDLDDISLVLGVTSAAASPEGVLTVQRAGRALIAPNGAGELETATWHVWLRLFDSRPVEVDRQETVDGTTLHPAFGVDLYRLTATPK